MTIDVPGSLVLPKSAPKAGLTRRRLLGGLGLAGVAAVWRCRAPRSMRLRRPPTA